MVIHKRFDICFCCGVKQEFCAQLCACSRTQTAILASNCPSSRRMESMITAHIVSTNLCIYHMKSSWAESSPCILMVSLPNGIICWYMCTFFLIIIIYIYISFTFYFAGTCRYMAKLSHKIWIVIKRLTNFSCSLPKADKIQCKDNSF